MKLLIIALQVSYIMKTVDTNIYLTSLLLETFKHIKTIQFPSHITGESHQKPIVSLTQTTRFLIPMRYLFYLNTVIKVSYSKMQLLKYTLS